MIMNIQIDNQRVNSRVNSYVYRLFIILFYIELILALCPAWNGSFVFKYLSYETYIFMWETSSRLAIIVFSFLILCAQKKIYSPSIFYITLILYYFVLASISFNGFKSGGLVLSGLAISYLVLFDTLRQYYFSQKHLKLIFYAFLLWCIIPIIYYWQAPDDVKLLFVTGHGGNSLTFGGFAQHRNFYGAFWGMTFICLLVWKMNPLLKLVLCIILLIGLIMSVCRTAMVSVVVTSFYILFFQKKKSFRKKVIGFFSLIIIVLTCYILLTNSEFVTRDISSNDDRIELWRGMSKIIEENFFWGVGEEALYYSKNFPDGAPAHNFILAAVAGYGIFVFICFGLLLIVVVKRAQFYFKTFLVYLVCWGLTQPYFGFGVPSALIFIALFWGNLLDNNRKKASVDV